jgi:SAM-dependent methyltransferase
MADHYADGTYRWWHLSRPSPELVSALEDGWLPGRGRAVDVGCGLGSEVGYLALAGWQVAGVDLSEAAVAGAVAEHDGAAFLRADVRRLPFGRHSLDAALDRGCFHYLAAGDRPRYAGELGRVLRPGGKLLLRASLRVAGVRNEIDEAVIRDAFAGWRIEYLQRAAVPSDTRALDVLVVRLSTSIVGTPEERRRPKTRGELSGRHRGRCVVAVDDQHGAGGVLGYVRADRAEQEPGEPPVPAAADNQHDRALASVEQDFGGAPLEYLPLQPGRRVIAEDGPHAVIEHVPHVPRRVPICRHGRPPVRGREFPGGYRVDARVERRGEAGTPPQGLQGMP